MSSRSLLLILLTSLAVVQAITVYGQQPLGQTVITASASTNSAAQPSYTGYKAYNPTVLNPPPLPNPLPATQFGIQLQPSSANVPGLSIPQSGAFFGFSVETSVINQIIRAINEVLWYWGFADEDSSHVVARTPRYYIKPETFTFSDSFSLYLVDCKLAKLSFFCTGLVGVNASFIQVPFLNLVSLVIARAGRFHIRVGGNTQETASFVQNTADGRMIEKQGIDPNKPTATPALIYTIQVFYLLSNISSLVNVKWYLGVPLNDTSNLRLEIAEYGQQILGDNLIGLQIGNEPDLYLRHQKRPAGYNEFSYFNEFGQVLSALQNDPLITNTNSLIGPSIASADWTPEMVWNTGFISTYSNHLGALSVENYPEDNCAAIYSGLGTPKNPQDEFPKYLDHQAGNSGHRILQKYLNSTAIAQQAGKPFIMFETNTASCGGFAGISNSFGAALWAIDYGLQAAYSNFSHVLLHIGGQDVFYNPCTPPPTGQSAYHQWTIGPIMYSVLVVAETFGSSNNSQIIDIQANGGNVYTPGYAIYENGNLARVALLNYMTDSSGANDYTATISVGGGNLGLPNGVPAQVTVKYLLAPSVSELFNVTWANQTFGGQFQSDGRLKGDEVLVTVSCDQNANTCAIKVPAPGFALVFFTDAALQESTPTTTATFATTAVTKKINTATIDAGVLATSNGHSGKDRQLGSTSKGSTGKGSNGAGQASAIAPSIAVLATTLAGVVVLIKALSH